MAGPPVLAFQCPRLSPRPSPKWTSHTSSRLGADTEFRADRRGARAQHLPGPALFPVAGVQSCPPFLQMSEDSLRREGLSGCVLFLLLTSNSGQPSLCRNPDPDPDAATRWPWWIKTLRVS